MPAVPIIALGVAAVGTGYSIYSGERAASANKKAVKAQRQQANLQSAIQKRDAIRAGRLANANAVVAAENQGVSNSSSAQGGQGSIISQVSSGLSFLDKYGALSDQATKSLGHAQIWNTRSQDGAAVAGLAGTALAYSGDISKAWNKIFPK